MAKNVLQKPGRALEIGANLGTASASQGSKAALSSLTRVTKFHHTVKRLYLGNIVNSMLYKRSKKHKLYPSAPFEIIDLEQRLEIKLCCE